MIKTFITVIAEQPPKNLLPTKYASPEDEKLLCDKLLKFPISTAINAYAKEDDEIKIIAIMNEDNENTKINFEESFIPELESLKKENNLKNLDTSKIIKIKADTNQGINCDLRLLEDLLAAIGDNEILHACITYGTKPLPIIIFMALNYVYKVRNNTNIETIIYGTMYSGKKNEPTIYDETALFYTNEMFMQLADAGVSDPVKKVKAMRGILEE